MASNKGRLKGKNIGLIIMVFCAALLLVFLLIRNSILNKSPVSLPDEIRIESEDCEVKVSGDGLTEYECQDEIFYHSLSKEDVGRLFRYIDGVASSQPNTKGGCLVTYIKGGETINFFIDCADSLINEIVGDIEGGLGGGSISEYFDGFFSTPTPTATASPTSSPPPDGSDCPFWKLGMCVYPFPTPTPPPDESDTVWDCALWSEHNTKATIISDTVCLGGEE